MHETNEDLRAQLLQHERTIEKLQSEIILQNQRTTRSGSTTPLRSTTTATTSGSATTTSTPQRSSFGGGAGPSATPVTVTKTSTSSSSNSASTPNLNLNSRVAGEQNSAAQLEVYRRQIADLRADKQNLERRLEESERYLLDKHFFISWI
ncbi:hypothetical protein HMI54_001438 [Coelomomyces lativittatus]|nr:hypothetical protein HMI54_001438 [Coelomomyces lativittatus]